MRKLKMTPGMLFGIGALVCALLLAACPSPNDDPDNDEDSPLLGKVLILQAYGNYEEDDGAVSHCFVELYNVTGTAIDLSACSIQYAALASNTWNVTNLTESIPAHSSYLIRGWHGNNTNARVILSTVTADVEDTSF
jgi:hypothetical protein